MPAAPNATTESIALGNEESDIQFLSNYPQFSDAVRASYPDIEIICNSGPSPNPRSAPRRQRTLGPALP